MSQVPSYLVKFTYCASAQLLCSTPCGRLPDCGVARLVWTAARPILAQLCNWDPLYELEPLGRDVRQCLHQLAGTVAYHTVALAGEDG